MEKTGVTDVSVIIVNYKTANLVVDCISSIRVKTSGVSYEVIVVDNNSGDGIDRTMAEHFGDSVKVVMLPENIGFGRANNEGFKAASGRNLLCLNPDTLLRNNAIAILSQYLDEHEDVGAVGGNLYCADGSPAWSMGRMYPGIMDELSGLTVSRLGKLLYGSSTMFNHSGHPLEVAWVLGADLMVKSSVIKKTGGFDPAFFMFSEDVDLCWQIHDLGLKVVSVPDAEITHLEGKSYRKSASDRNLVMGEHSHLYCLRKHRGRLVTLLSHHIRRASFRLSAFLLRKKPQAAEVYRTMQRINREESYRLNRA